MVDEEDICPRCGEEMEIVSAVNSTVSLATNNKGEDDEWTSSVETLRYVCECGHEVEILPEEDDDDD